VSGAKPVDELRYIPLVLNTNGDTLWEASSYDGTHALVYVDQRYKPCEEEIYYNVAGQPAVGFFMYICGYYCFYARLECCTSVNRLVTQIAAVSVNSKQMNIVLGPGDREIRIGAIEKVRSWTDVPTRNKWAARIINARTKDGVKGSLGYDWPNLKVTGGHHTLVTVEEAAATCELSRLSHVAEALAYMAGYVKDAHEAFVAGLVLWVIAADLRLVENILYDATFKKVNSVTQWAGVAKSVSSEFKNIHHYTDVPLEQAFELQVLVNRGVGEVDWANEQRNRVNPVLVEVDQAQVYMAAKEILLRAKSVRKPYARKSWPEFWEERWAATPTGSVHTQYFDQSTYVDKDRLKRTKQYTVTKMPSEYSVDELLLREPEIRAWPSVKYEWSKQRAIYGTDLTSFLLTDFAMPRVEEAISGFFPVGKMADETYVARKINLMGTTGVSVCFDYEDFNSQHSFGSMISVLKAYLEVYGIDMSEDQRRAMFWVIASVKRQIVEAKERSYRSSGTLFSGWRLTTFINTMLNHIYLEVAGARKHWINSIHNGDDVLAYASDLKQAIASLAAASDAGIRAQDEKCVIAGTQEFLRVDRLAVNATGAQYLTRAIATAVHARAEAREPDDVVVAYEAQHTRIMALGQRGAAERVTSRLMQMCRRTIAMVFESKVEDLLALETMHRVQGGMSIKPPLHVRLKVSKERDTMLDTSAEEKLPGVRDYTKHLIKFFGINRKHRSRINETVATAMKKMITYIREPLSFVGISDEIREKLKIMLYKVCADEIALKTFIGKARLASIPIGALTVRKEHSLAMIRLSKAENPLEVMSYIF
jgi:hypothetical protein